MKHSNLLLQSLPEADLHLLMPRLKPLHFRQHHVLFECGDEVGIAYFPTTAIISLVVGLSTGEMVEAAMVGHDGVVSAASALVSKIALSRAVIQHEGDVLCCDADALRDVAMRSKSVLSMLLRHEQAVFSQAQQSTACMSRHPIEERLCRWLLRARDLARSDTLNITHDHLAEMLGVRRSSVTQAAQKLQVAGLIKYSRGQLKCLEVEGMRRAACECYLTVNEHYREVLGLDFPADPLVILGVNGGSNGGANRDGSLPHPASKMPLR